MKYDIKIILQEVYPDSQRLNSHEEEYQHGRRADKPSGTGRDI
jgi:hypothetical protein